MHVEFVAELYCLEDSFSVCDAGYMKEIYWVIWE